MYCEIDIAAMRKKWQRAKNAGSVLYHEGRRVATFNPASLSLVQQALIEAQEILQRSGAGAMFSVYSQLSERYGSLIVLLPVAQQTTDVIIAKFLEYLELIKLVATDENKTKMYPLSHPFGIGAAAGHADVAGMFSTDAEQTLKDVREMLTYSLHLIQTAQQQMRAEMASPLHLEKIEGWTKLQQRLNYPDMANEDIEAVKRSIPNAGADKLTTDDERVYNFVTSTYARPIADSAGAYNEHQRWKRELLMSLGNDDSADGGGNAVTL